MRAGGSEGEGEEIRRGICGKNKIVGMGKKERLYSEKESCNNGKIKEEVKFVRDI